jgi:hypothetical protein
MRSAEADDRDIGILTGSQMALRCWPPRNCLGATALGLQTDLMPSAATVAVLMDPTNANTVIDLEESQSAAGALGLQVHLLRQPKREIDTEFAALAQKREAATNLRPTACTPR